MRYIKPPDFKSVKDLQEHYKRLEEEITELLLNDASANTAQELNKKLSLALNAAMSYLTKVNKDFTNNELPRAFNEGRSALKDSPKISAEKAQAILEKKGYKYAKNGFSRDTYIELQTATKTALNGVKSRVNEIIKDLRKDGQDSVYNVQQTLLKELQQHGLTKVKYSNGAEMPLSAYAAMAARSARIESTNIGSIGSALQNGTDFVKMTSVPQCCKLCGAYQGKVYSITGKDKRFPSLFNTVLKNGYALPHPNCRHEFIPWFEETEAPEDVERAIKNSKIKYDGKGNLVDVRYQKDIEAYQAWQAGNRQRNREELEFEQMRNHYAGRENEMPYKTLASFRRARRADNLSPAFKAWRYREMDTNTLTRWSKVKNFKNCPKTLENLQEIKYNKLNEWEVLKRERKTIEDINGKNWTEDFKQKAFDTYYKFREKGIEFTDHGIAKYLQRSISEKQALENINNKFNYIQNDGKFIKFYNGLTIVYNKEKTEIISFIYREKVRSDWYEIIYK